MKKIVLISAFILSLISYSQDPIEVIERQESYSVGVKNSLVSNIPLGNEDIVESIIKDELKKWKGKLTSKEEYFLEAATKTVISEKPIDIYVRIIKLAKGKIEVAYAIDLGGAFLNKANHPEKYRLAEGKIMEISKNIAIKAIDIEVEKEEDKLKDLEKDFDNLVKDKSKLEKEIINLQEDIADYKNEIIENKALQSATKTKIDELHNSQSMDSDLLKELNKEQENNYKKMDKINTSITKAEEDIERLKSDIDSNIKSQSSKQDEITNQKNYISKEVKSKYNKIK